MQSNDETRPIRVHRRDRIPRVWIRLCWATLVNLGNFTSQEFDICLCTRCVDSSSQQISSILVGHFTRGGNDSLRQSPQSSAKCPQTMPRSMSESWLAKFPRSICTVRSHDGSHDVLGQVRLDGLLEAIHLTAGSRLREWDK